VITWLVALCTGGGTTAPRLGVGWRGQASNATGTGPIQTGGGSPVTQDVGSLSITWTTCSIPPGPESWATPTLQHRPGVIRPSCGKREPANQCPCSTNECVC
jgi:hypothetical protein